jgi:hypothetical protein
MDVDVRQAIAEITRDDSFADFVAELSREERAALAGQLRTLLAEDGRKPRSAGATLDRSVVVRCGDRGCRGVVADASGTTVRFVSLEKATDANSTSEMAVVESSVEIHECVESVPSVSVYCPACWVCYPLLDVLREVRVARLVGRPRRAMATRTW